MKLSTIALFGVLSFATLVSAANQDNGMDHKAMDDEMLMDDKTMDDEMMMDYEVMNLPSIVELERAGRNAAYKLRLKESRASRRQISSNRAQQEAVERRERIAIRATTYSVGPSDLLAIQNSNLNGEQILPLVISARRAFYPSRLFLTDGFRGTFPSTRSFISGGSFATNSSLIR